MDLSELTFWGQNLQEIFKWATSGSLFRFHLDQKTSPDGDNLMKFLILKELRENKVRGFTDS